MYPYLVLHHSLLSDELKIFDQFVKSETKVIVRPFTYRLQFHLSLACIHFLLLGIVFCWFAVKFIPSPQLLKPLFWVNDG